MKRRSAFTLVEIIVVIVIIGILATLIAPRILGRISQSKTTAAGFNANAIANAMKNFQIDCGRLPSGGASVNILWEKPSDIDASLWRGPYVDNKDMLLDPWKKPFILRVPGQKNVDFDIISYGADGKPGGEGEDEDVIKP